jgi:hypothetical protein
VDHNATKQWFLVSCDYGTGAIYFFLWARSREEIESTFPTRLDLIDDPRPGLIGGDAGGFLAYDIDDENEQLLRNLRREEAMLSTRIEAKMKAWRRRRRGGT